jgi:hypothetical protein
MNSLRWVSFRTPRKRWQPLDEVAGPDRVLGRARILVHMSKQVLPGSDSQQARWRASRGLGGVARQLGVGRELEFFLR